MTSPAEPGTRARFWLLGIACLVLLLAGGTVGFLLSGPPHRAASSALP